MKIINDKGIVLVSLYFLILGAYYIIYAKLLYTATGIAPCLGAECIMFGFLKILALSLGFIGCAYIVLALLIRFHRVGCYLALAACAFNMLFMATYLVRPTIFPLWLTFIFPIRMILTTGLEYVPAQTGDAVSLLETGVEIFMILLNIGIAAYLLRCLGREVWGPAEGKHDEEDEDDDELSEDELEEAVKETFRKK